MNLDLQGTDLGNLYFYQVLRGILLTWQGGEMLP